MSTRSTINFCNGDRIDAKIYRHSDGYPESVLPDLERFFSDVKEDTDDTRFDDSCYLAAKYVVWQANENNKHYDLSTREFVRRERLDFLGVGVLMEDPGDIEHTYYLDCHNLDEKGHPTVTHKEVAFTL
jgi:hypothetical protein